MAERRMMNRNLLSSDHFQDLSLENQALYFHLCLNADDDGFLGNAKSITRMLGLPPDALTTMADAGYLILFDSGVTVIRHWRIHNSIRKDRYVQTMYQREFALLALDEEGVYQLLDEPRKTDESDGCQSGNQTATQVREGEVREEQERRVYCTHESVQQNAPDQKGTMLLAEGLLPPAREDVITYARQINSKVDPNRFYDYYDARNWTRGHSRIQNWQAAFRCWENREKEYAAQTVTARLKPLPAQQYSQRDYCGGNARMDDVLDRLDADALSSAKVQEMECRTASAFTQPSQVNLGSF